MTSAILLITCPDCQGLEATVSQFVYLHKGNVIRSEHHIDESQNIFCMRIEWSMNKFDLNKPQLIEHFTPLAKKYSMQWKFFLSNEPLKMGILVSKHNHCLWDILIKYKENELNVQIPLIISNHPDLKYIADIFSIPFFYFKMTKEDKKEKEILALLKENNVDFIAMARYMQILSNDFIEKYENKIINIHHSFLPAFAGGKPYHQAYERGVKLIGATSHYATADLDEGPIIEQDVIRITHADNIKTLQKKGKNLERQVFVRAVNFHCLHKILVYGNKTAVFK